MTFLIITFWFSIFAILYTIALYPAILFIAGLFIKRPTKRDDLVRSVDLIIPVCNGEKEIEKKILNCLAFDYPDHALKITIISDGSDDRTGEIAGQYVSKRVKFLSLTERHGKVAAQNIAIQDIESDIVVFTDVSILLKPDALKTILSNFADESVGAVSCRDQIEQISDEKTGDAVYINYDMMVRKLTTRIGTLIGVTGGFYAVRREVAQGGWEPSFPPDFYAALRAIGMGYRVIEDDRVIAKYYTPNSSNAEMDRKVRTITRGMWALFQNLKLLNPLKFGVVSLQLLSHKIMRWLIPFFMIILFVSNSVIFISADILFYAYSFWFQVFAGLLMVISFVAISYNNLNNRFFRLPAMLFIFNLSLLISWKNVLTGKKIIKWEPTKRV